MAASNGRIDDPLIQRLENEPHRFDFFQAVRLLANHSRSDEAPCELDEIVDAAGIRFLSHPSGGFPGASISGVSVRNDNVSMGVTFLGLVGAQGVLPDHFSRRVIERLRKMVR